MGVLEVKLMTEAIRLQQSEPKGKDKEINKKIKIRIKVNPRDSKSKMWIAKHRPLDSTCLNSNQARRSNKR